MQDTALIKLPDGQFLRVRAIYYNDKGGDYTYYLDLMVPHGATPVYTPTEIERALGTGWVLDDGVPCYFDVAQHYYLVSGDHYDPDHYDYYVPYIGSFLTGHLRAKPQVEQSTLEEYASHPRRVKGIDGSIINCAASAPFNRLVEALKRVPKIQVVWTENSAIEVAAQLFTSGGFQKFYEEFRVDPECLFHARVALAARSRARLTVVLSYLPQRLDRHFTLTKMHSFLPGPNGGGAIFEPDNNIYFLDFGVHSHLYSNVGEVRAALNDYFIECANLLERNVL